MAPRATGAVYDRAEGDSLLLAVSWVDDEVTWTTTHEVDHAIADPTFEDIEVELVT